MSFSFDLYWSFRSPYSYLATKRLRALPSKWEVRVRPRPVYPIAIRTPNFFQEMVSHHLGHANSHIYTSVINERQEVQLEILLEQIFLHHHCSTNHLDVELSFSEGFGKIVSMSYDFDDPCLLHLIIIELL